MGDEFSEQFSGKVAVVTGASSGLGQDIAELFASRGASVVLCGRDPERLSAAMDSCRTLSAGRGSFTTVMGDVDLAETRDRIVAAARDELGGLDILVCNASGGFVTQGFMTDTEDFYDKMFNSQLKSPYFMIQAALPELIKSKGNVILIGSIGGTFAKGRFIVYSMAKAGIDNLTRNLSLSLAEKDIRVNCVKPSTFHSRCGRDYDAILGYDVMEKEMAKIAPQHPLGRCTTVREQSNVVAFLASPRANFITGQCVTVDGGISINKGAPVGEKMDK